MIIEDFPQYSTEWWSARRGIPTASKFEKIVTSTGKRSSSFETYAYSKAAEIMTGKLEDEKPTEWMLRGTELESKARSAYSIVTGATVVEVGVVYRDKKKLWSCSPDGIVLPTKTCQVKGGVEIKCPKQGTMARYLYKNELPTERSPQVYGSLWVCDELEYWDFFAYHPDMEPFRIRIDRDDEGFQIYSEALDRYMPSFVEMVKNISR